jgi:hypothetical protein
MIPPMVDYLLNKIAYEKIRDYGKDKFLKDFAKRYMKLSPAEKI